MDHLFWVFLLMPPNKKDVADRAEAVKEPNYATDTEISKNKENRKAAVF